MKEHLLTTILKLQNVLILGRRALKGKKINKKLIKNSHSNTNPPHVNNTQKFTK